MRNSLWLIDFAKAGKQALFVDAAKVVSVILFEQFPVPLTLDDIRRGGDGEEPHGEATPCRVCLRCEIGLHGSDRSGRHR